MIQARSNFPKHPCYLGFLEVGAGAGAVGPFVGHFVELGADVASGPD